VILSKIIENAIFEGDKQTPDEYRKGKFFILSMGILFFLSIVSIPYYFDSQFNFDPLLKKFYLLTMVLFLAIFFIYPKYGHRILLANIYFVITFLLNAYGTYKNGGIYSPDNFSGIVIIIFIFLVANRLSGYIWAVVHILLFSFYYYVDANNWADFKAALEVMPNHYFFGSLVFGLVFGTIIIHLHENSKESYLKELAKSKADLEDQKKMLEMQKEDIVSSIQYARRIQNAILPQEDTIYRNIPLSFILYKPRDIVSGDFFWFHEIDGNNYIIVCADCTGHGVPGALMTVIGSNLLTQIITENRLYQPAAILQELDVRISTTLKQHKLKEEYVHDGMDLAMLKVDKQKKEFTYTSAKRPAIFIRDKQLQEFKGSKCSLGGFRQGEKKFEEININYLEDDVIYLFTDGYIDQFGGSDNKKFMIKRFRELLLKIHTKQMHEQKQIAEHTINEWIGNNEQTDDIALIGIRF